TFNYMWNGFDIVTVSFIPLLTSPNLDAPAIPVSTPSPTPSITPAQTPSTSPTPTAFPTETHPHSPVVTSPTPTQVIVQSVPTWFYAVVAGLVVVIAVLLGALVLILRRKFLS
ncbi:MAG TPA: hypothetical protein VMD05_02095, partial [Candidatus Nanoarchaeia archaeon]|nr:hypothetical protein [Candidatus Nanoarchaeia archaeon]